MARSISEVETYVKKYNDNVLFCIWAKNDVERELIKTRLNGKNIILLAGSEKNPELSEFLATLPSDIMVIDPSGHIASYGMLDLVNLITWPVSNVSEAKTINLKVFWYSLGGAFVLSLLIILIIRIRSKRKEARMNLKRKIAQLEVDAVRSRMNPHFLFNALGSIQNLVNRGKNQEASLYLARFGDLVRTILTQSSKPVIGLNEEIDMIRNYLLLEQLGSPFTFEIQVNPSIDPATIEIPQLLIQPHVENAVIHGISSLGEAGKIEIDFRLEDNHLICEVTDNGPGYHPGSRPEKEGLGLGWKLTLQRIRLMKEQYGEEVSVEVSNRNPYGEVSSKISGTTVTFRLPMQKSAI
ncbi:MAG: histidine kinase [Bacteroidia bacterium]|nr:histidine kinase [Bacteroidia bacterium]